MTESTTPGNVRAEALAYTAARTPVELTLTPAEKALVAALLELGIAHSPLLDGAESYDFECVMRDLYTRLDAPYLPEGKPRAHNGPLLAAMHRIRDEA